MIPDEWDADLERAAQVMADDIAEHVDNVTRMAGSHPPKPCERTPARR